MFIEHSCFQGFSTARRTHHKRRAGLLALNGEGTLRVPHQVAFSLPREVGHQQIRVPVESVPNGNHGVAFIGLLLAEREGNIGRFGTVLALYWS